MWNGTTVKPLGGTRLKIRNPKVGKNYSVEFVIVNEDLTPLLSLRATEQMKLLSVHRENFKAVNSVRACSRGEILAKYPDVFNNKLGKLEGEVHLHVDPDVVPVTLPARSGPVSVRKQLKAELDRLTRLGVLTMVDQPTAWTSQFVTTTKSSGEIRICIDPKPLNEALKRERYQMLTLDELLPELSNAKVFTKVDLSSAYWHLVLDEESSLLTTFITPFGRYCWLRLPFGLKVSSEIFQKRLNQALEGLPGVFCIADDVLIIGTNDPDHDANLEKLLLRCREKGISLNPDKFKLRCPTIPFHGHLLTKDGLKADPEKIEAITKMPRPENTADVQRLNGMVNYLSRFLPHLSDVMKPIRQLTHSDTEWHWSESQEQAFTQLKSLITSTPVLVYYDPEKHLEIQCDSSQSGLGAAILQEGRPIAYASRALTAAEVKYAQIEKEMLAVVYAFEKFHDYTYGRHTIVYSDHKPLEMIQNKRCTKLQEDYNE